MFLPLRLVVFVLRWSPVWVPAILIWQISERGLKPALAEQKRLGEARGPVEERHAESEAEFARLEAELEAWDDEVYRDRRRRALEQARAQNR
jgi:hypothetical protein